MVLKYRNRVVNEHDVEAIRGLIAKHAGESRRKLSRRLCEEWDWRQENGQLRDMVCRGLMLALHRAGHIDLPQTRIQIKNPMVNRQKPQKVEIDQSEIAMSFSVLPPLEIRLVRQTKEESLFNSLLETHHYLGYSRPVGEHLKYMVFMGDRPLACLAWCCVLPARVLN